MLFFYSLLPLLVILLSACSAISPLAANLTETITPEPSKTPTPAPSPTPAPTGVFPAIPTKPTQDPSFFRDDFVKMLDAQWSWIREDPRNWSLEIVPGALQINAGKGFVLAHTNTNLLLRPAPEGNFQIETQITFQPTDNFDFAGLIVYETDSNFIQAGHGFCGSVDCVGDGLYMHSYQKGLDEALIAHELIKVKFMDFRDQKRELTEQLAAASGSALVGMIGNIAILYRQQQEPQKRKIALPV